MAIELAVWAAGDAPTRVFAGASVGRRSGRLKAALIRGRGDGWNFRVVAADALTVGEPPAGEIPLADAIAEAIASLANRVGAPLASVDAVGIDHLGANPSTNAADILAARVAERTGLTVVAGFARRDQAAGGAGDPLSPIPDWFLFRSARLTRLLVHLGPSLRVTLLPAGGMPIDGLCFDVGPCGDFLDGLVQDLSEGRYPFDPHGRLAVQGQASTELVGKWASHPFFLRPPPKTIAPGEFGGEFRQASLAWARDQRLAGRDVLCSANLFIIRNLDEAMRRFLPGGDTLREAWVTGGGSWNGLLWKRLKETLAPLPVARTDKIGIPLEARSALHAALLAYCAYENLPGNSPTVTGAARRVTLGQIAPGDEEHWDQFICNHYDRFESGGREAA